MFYDLHHIMRNQASVAKRDVCILTERCLEMLMAQSEHVCGRHVALKPANIMLIFQYDRGICWENTVLF